jgi:hypothetical protein
MLFTFQILMELVPPETNAENWVVVTIFTETVAGDIVTEIPVTGSVHVEEDDELEVVEVVVVQVTAVLVAAVLLQETEPRTARTDAMSESRFTAPLFSLTRALILGGSIPGILDPAALIAGPSAPGTLDSCSSISLSQPLQKLK